MSAEPMVQAGPAAPAQQWCRRNRAHRRSQRSRRDQGRQWFARWPERRPAERAGCGRQQGRGHLPGPAAARSPGQPVPAPEGWRLDRNQSVPGPARVGHPGRAHPDRASQAEPTQTERTPEAARAVVTAFRSGWQREMPAGVPQPPADTPQPPADTPQPTAVAGDSRADQPRIGKTSVAEASGEARVTKTRRKTFPRRAPPSAVPSAVPPSAVPSAVPPSAVPSAVPSAGHRLRYHQPRSRRERRRNGRAEHGRNRSRPRVAP